MKYLSLYKSFISEAVDTWSRSEDKNWVMLRRTDVPNVPFGDEVSDYFSRYEPDNITSSDIKKLEKIVNDFNAPPQFYSTHNSTPRQSKPIYIPRKSDVLQLPNGEDVSRDSVYSYVEIRSGTGFNWSCKVWFHKRQFMSNDFWIINTQGQQKLFFNWNDDTVIYESTYILCDGLEGVEEFFKSYKY